MASTWRVICGFRANARPSQTEVVAKSRLAAALACLDLIGDWLGQAGLCLLYIKVERARGKGL